MSTNKASRQNPYADGSYPITEMYLFPAYQTRQEYKASTGEEAPPFNPAQPVKNWRDISALKKRTVLYKFLLSDDMGNLSVGIEEVLSGAYAASVNMLPENFTGLNDEEKKNGAAAFPVPVRDLFPGEEIVIGFGGVPNLRDKSLAKSSASGGACNCNLSDAQIDRIAARIAEVLTAKGFLVPASE